FPGRGSRRRGSPYEGAGEIPLDAASRPRTFVGMNRSAAEIRPTRRLASLLLALLVFVTGAAQDGYGLRPCAHHDAAAKEIAATSHADGHAHGAHHGAAGGAHQDAPADDGCSCVGTCGTGGAVVVPPLAVSAALSTEPAHEAAFHQPDE